MEELELYEEYKSVPAWKWNTRNQNITYLAIFSRVSKKRYKARGLWRCDADVISSISICDLNMTGKICSIFPPLPSRYLGARI